MNQNTGLLLTQSAAHVHFVANERRSYRGKIQLSRLQPTEYLPIMVYDADESAYKLFHFVVPYKDQRELEINVQLVSLIHYGANRLHLFSMNDKH